MRLACYMESARATSPIGRALHQGPFFTPKLSIARKFEVVEWRDSVGNELVFVHRPTAAEDEPRGIRGGVVIAIAAGAVP